MKFSDTTFDDWAEALAYWFLDQEAADNLIAETNACGWGFDDAELLAINGPTAEGALAIKYRIAVSGDPDPDKMFCGERIFAVITAAAVYRDDAWTMIDQEIVEAKIDESYADDGVDDDFDSQLEVIEQQIEDFYAGGDENDVS